MLPTLITIIVVGAGIVLWTISKQRKLVMLEENICNAMSQIGVQISGRFDALEALLDLSKGYAINESEPLINTVKSRRSMITAKSSPDDVLLQEGVISETLNRIAILTEQYPELKTNQNYIKAMDAVETFERMVRTSCLIYNESVAKLNREIRMIPVSIIAAILGFRQREYLDALEPGTDKESIYQIETQKTNPFFKKSIL